MHFFITAIKICHTHIRPTQTSENIFSVDSLNFVIKELGGQPNPRGGGYCHMVCIVTFCRVWFSSMQLSLGLSIEIREQFLYREVFGKFSLVQ